MKIDKGQILVGAILLLMFALIIIPAMVVYIQNESRWSVKQEQNSHAFQLAEAALDRGYQKVSESTTTWNAVKNGQSLSGFYLDKAYTDLPGGSYAISIASGPGTGEATIIGIGRDANKKEVRALKAVYANAALGESTAVRSLGVISLSGSNEEVEWGCVMSPLSIATNNRNHPQFLSSANISPQDTNGSAPPNTDSVQWWSYLTSLPTVPNIDFGFYQSSAQATGTYYGGNQNWAPPCGDATSCDTGKTYYIDGNLNVGSPGIFVGGNLIIRGNLSLPNGRSGQGSPTVHLPRKAWKQYGKDWAFYTSGGPACSQSWNDTTLGRPASFPGLNSTYLSDPNITVTFSTGKVLVKGFLYVGGNMTQGGGGGQSLVVGSAYVAGNVTLGANNLCIFYTDEAGKSIVTTNISLSRESWQDILQGWPAGLP